MRDSDAAALVRWLQRVALAVERAADGCDRIADAAEALAAALGPAADAAPGDDGVQACTHPADARIDFGVTAGRADWQCGVCGFRPADERE